MNSTQKSFRNLRDRHGSPLASLAMTLPRDRTKINEPLALHTYIKLGGPADIFTVAKSAGELAGAVTAAEEAGVPWFILGGGSNILVGDLGVRGLVIKNEAEGIRVSRRLLSDQDTRGLPRAAFGGSRNDGVTLIAESGVKMAKLAAFASEHGLGGLEVFMSVPGTLGGAIFNNSHYRPQKNEFIGNLVESAEIMVFDDPRRHFFGTLGQEPSLTSLSPPGQRASGVLPGSSSMTSKMAPSDHLNRKIKKVIVSRDWFNFGYDYSRLQEEKAVVLRVMFRLKRESLEVLKERAMELLKQRNLHQPIGKPSCGCMFKNPNGVSARLSARQAGKLIDEAGMKGAKVGGVRVSQTHANFMVNDGSGKVRDVLELLNRVKTKVKEFHGVELEPEIFFIGDFGSKMIRNLQNTQNTLKARLSENQRSR